jgi:prepilin-type N-terminal cleavage/methylation domain-containing protein
MIQDDRAGFGLAELVVVLLVVSILARLALPVYQYLVLKSEAAATLGAIQAVREAAYEYYEDTDAWPVDHDPGIVPPELEPYLSEGFSFDRRRHRLDWESWALPDGSPGHADLEGLVGISVTLSEATFRRALEAGIDSTFPFYRLGDRYTFLIAAH